MSLTMTNGPLKKYGLALILVLGFSAGQARPAYPAASGPSLKGTYGFSAVGTALLTPQGSSTPTLVPAAISGSIFFSANGTFGGEANVDVGGLACNAAGPGGTVTKFGGTYADYTTPAYAVGSLGVITSGSPGLPPCVQIHFSGPVMYSPSGATGVVFSADPNDRVLDIVLQ